MTDPALDIYHVDPPVIPREDRSGPAGERLFRLLLYQVRRDLAWAEKFRKELWPEGGEYRGPRAWDGPLYKGREITNQAVLAMADTAYPFAVINTFNTDTTDAGLREEAKRVAIGFIEDLSRTHLAAGANGWGETFTSTRSATRLGVAAWLLWDALSADTRLRMGRLLAREADFFNDKDPPGRLREDTLAEDTGWHSSGIATAYCMLKRHPNRGIWRQRAMQWMLGAYGTAADVTSDEVVDGKRLRDWHIAANVLADYTLENHGFIHLSYLSDYAEMLISAVTYAFAGEAVPESIRRSPARIHEVLTYLSLPDGTYLFPAGTDYTTRELGCALRPSMINSWNFNAAGEACFLRVLETMERIAEQGGRLPLSGYPLRPSDWYAKFLKHWPEICLSAGLTMAYLSRRCFGVGGRALPSKDVEKRLTGVRLFEHGRFVVHRRVDSASWFTWNKRRVLGMTLPLTGDVLCDVWKHSYIGAVRATDETGRAEPNDFGAFDAAIETSLHRVEPGEDGFRVQGTIAWARGKVLQDFAFVSLPDGRSVYFERRCAVADVELREAHSGGVDIFDDTRWPHQGRPRAFLAESGRVDPTDEPAVCKGCWLNVDNRMGYVALGRDSFLVQRVAKAYDVVRIVFNPQPVAGTFHAAKGEVLSCYVLLSCPNQKPDETRSLAAELKRKSFVREDGGMAVELEDRVVHGVTGSDL